jgi:hypothetical protein
MARHEIEFDEETDRMLVDLATEYGGDFSKALADLIHVHRSFETLADLSEGAQAESLHAQVERAEVGFREGRFTAWHEVKRRNEL